MLGIKYIYSMLKYKTYMHLVYSTIKTYEEGPKRNRTLRALPFLDVQGSPTRWRHYRAERACMTLCWEGYPYDLVIVQKNKECV